MPQDFSGQNLRGRNFKGQDLTGANFSYADIQGANFSNAVFLSILSGFVWAYAGSWVAIMVTSKNPYSMIGGLVPVLAIPVFFVVSIRQGVVAALGAMAWIGAALVVITGVLAVSWLALLRGALAGDPALSVGLTVGLVGSGALTVFLVVVGALAGSGVLAIACAVAGNRAFVMNVVVAIVMPIRVAQPLADALVKVWVSALARVGAGTVTPAMISAMPLGMAVAVGLLAIYIAKRALAEDEKYTLIHKIAVFFATMGGTNFHDGNLTDANFTNATLKCTKFTGANLSRTRFYQSQKIHLARVGKSYLDHPKLRQWLITGTGQDKNFDRLNLRGINFARFNLADASFIGADLSEANLQDADLSRAKLVQTQLDETDLTGATLTGVTIEDWGITSSTKLHGVRCEYVFMRIPTQDDPNPRRKPDNWNEAFKDGEFADFITPIVKTLDLYHNQDIDPRTIAISYRQLAENNPEAALAIVAMEVRGKNKDKFLLRVETSENANHSELNAEYFDNYNQIKSLPRDNLLLLIAEKDKQIGSLERMIGTALSSSSADAKINQSQVPIKQAS